MPQNAWACDRHLTSRPPTIGTPLAQTTRLSLVRALLALSFGTVLASSACSEFVRPELTGQTDFKVSELKFENTTLDYKLLIPLLNARPDLFLLGGFPYNPYREAEDRLRIKTFWQGHGHFEVQVPMAERTVNEETKEITLTWRLNEGPRYQIRKWEIRNAPPGWQEKLAKLVPFGAGSPVAVKDYRWVRHSMAEALRRGGYLRAEVYSRAFVDRAAERVDWYYFVDAAPKSVVGKVTVAGNSAVPDDVIVARAGLTPGESINFDTVEQREFDLLDLGAFNTARLVADYGTEFIVNAAPPDTWIPPDTGGPLKPNRVDSSGNIIPRDLPAEVDFTLHVVESPTTQVEMGVGANIDTERLDPFAKMRLQIRNAFGPLHHFVVEGHAGYAIRWRGEVDEPLGFYGSAAIKYITPMFLARLLDLHVTARIDEELYPGFHWRAASFGVGFRSTLARGLYLHIEPRFRVDWPVGIDDIDPTVRADAGIAQVERSIDSELMFNLTWDKRDNRVEAMRGHLIALRASLAPGGPLGDHGYLRTELDLRYIISLNQDIGIGLRAAGGWLFDLADEGVPIGSRFFGGGAWGSRGFGTRRLAPYAQSCDGADCKTIPIGGTSLFEGSVEFRWLPFRKQFGVVAFADFGGAGTELNPFDEGVSIAPGLGIRLRLWHIPIAFDFSYRVTDHAAYDALDRFFVYARIGESF
ncbi:MAG: outer membrane protein assembly factor BamA [Myxococcota bacterium]|jgi:outer membrane protein assembly factor BamA